jgi:hypothetical protein
MPVVKKLRIFFTVIPLLVKEVAEDSKPRHWDVETSVQPPSYSFCSKHYEHCLLVPKNLLEVFFLLMKEEAEDSNS